MEYKFQLLLKYLKFINHYSSRFLFIFHCVVETYPFFGFWISISSSILTSEDLRLIRLMTIIPSLESELWAETIYYGSRQNCSGYKVHHILAWSWGSSSPALWFPMDPVSSWQSFSNSILPMFARVGFTLAMIQTIFNQNLGFSFLKDTLNTDSKIYVYN